MSYELSAFKLFRFRASQLSGPRKASTNSINSTNPANALMLFAQAIHGQSQTGLHAADGQGQQSDFIF
jgi:hypothetical protein